MLAACTPVRGIVASGNQHRQMAEAVLHAYQAQDASNLFGLVPGKKDLKDLRVEFGRPEGASELKLAKVPSYSALKDSIQSRFGAGLSGVTDKKGLELKAVENLQSIELKGTDAAWHFCKITMASPGDVCIRKLTLMTFKGRCFLMSIDAENGVE